MTGDPSAPTPPASRTRRLVVTAIQILISVGLLTWIFHDITRRERIAELLQQADPLWILAAIASAAVGIGAGIVRWRLFLNMLELRLESGRLTAIYLIGSFFDLFLLGATGGDAAKVVCVIREYPERKTAAFMSIAMDHMSGLGALLAATALFTVSRADVFLAHPITATMFWFLIGYVSLALIGILFCVIVSRFPIPAWLPRPGRTEIIAAEMHLALAQMRREWRASLAAVAVSFVVIFGYYFTFYSAARALAVPISLPAFLSAMPVVEALVSLPVSVAGLGVREKSFEYLLGALANIPIESAVLISLGGFLGWSFWALVGGIVFAFYRKSSTAT